MGCNGEKRLLFKTALHPQYAKQIQRFLTGKFFSVKGEQIMASFVIDSELFRDQYGTEEMRQVFSDRQLIQNWMSAWVALSAAEAELGIVGTLL